MIVVYFVPICSFSIRNISFLVPSKTDVFKNERVAGGGDNPSCDFYDPNSFFLYGGFLLFGINFLEFWIVLGSIFR